MNKKEFKKLQLQYLELTKRIEELEKIYKQQIKPYEEAFFASSMNDAEIEKLTKKDMEIRKKLKLDDLEIKLIKIKDELIKEGIKYILNIATEEEKKNIEYLMKNYKRNIKIINKLANTFSRMQV